MGFSRQKYWSGLPFPPPGDLPDPGVKPASSVSPALRVESLPAEPLGKADQNIHAKLLQSCLTLRDLMDYSLPGSSVHGVFQARILEWVVISYSRGTSQLKDRTCISMSDCKGMSYLY